MYKGIQTSGLVFLCSLLLFTLLTKAYTEEEENVLILHSYNEGYPWTDEVHKGIREVLDGRKSVNLSIDYLETRD